MRVKNCSKCKQVKLLSEFYADKSRKDNLRHICIKCDYIAIEKYKKTKDGLATKLYCKQIENSKKRGHELPTYTKEEFKNWLSSQDLFYRLYDDWVLNNYDTDFRPSVDRLNNAIGYSMDNIQLLTWKENREKEHKIRNINKAKVIVCYPHWVKDDPAWLAILIKGNRVIKEKIVIKTELSRAYFQSTGTYASPVITVEEVDIAAAYILSKVKLK